MLMHHADAGADGRFRVRNASLLAVDVYLAFIGFIETVDDAHQGRFSGAVFTHYAVDGAFFDLKIDVLIRVHSTETLVYSA